MLALLSLLASSSAAFGGGTILYAGGAWAALDRGSICEALSRSAKLAPKGQVQAEAGFSFSPHHRRWGEFHARLSRMPREGASVLLRVGGEPFLLVQRDGWAWSRGPLQEQAIIAALRTAPALTVESRDSSGRRFVDPYALDGAATAIDAAAARCALRDAGKIP
jgi:hypothetical protein